MKKQKPLPSEHIFIEVVWKKRGKPHALKCLVQGPFLKSENDLQLLEMVKHAISNIRDRARVRKTLEYREGKWCPK